ncbi:MAG: PKD domain-containing protein [Bacteroidetes bacterium]|nr:PKD domain-containing protein [Bacteroidota bacterium]
MAFSQHQSYNYYIAFSGKYFKSDGKNGVQRGFDSKFIHPEVFDHQNGYASISDHRGHLLYYSDGYSIFNSSYQKLKGSISKNHLIKISEKYIFKIAGGQSNFCVIAQSGNKTYLQFFNENGVYLIDSSLNEDPIEPFPGIMNHCSRNGNWLITKSVGINKYRVYYLDSLGLSKDPIISIISNINTLSYPSHVFSSNSRNFTVISSNTGLNGPIDIDLFNFDQANGKITHNKKIFSNLSNKVTKEKKVNLPGSTFSTSGKYIFFFGRYLESEEDIISKSGTCIFRYEVETGNSELVFQSGPITQIFARFFNTINPKQLVFTINAGFTRAEVGYGFANQSRLFSIEKADEKNSNNLIFRDFIVPADTMEYFVFNGFPSQNYLPVQESSLQIKASCIPEKSTFTAESKLPIYDVKWDLGDGTFLSGSSTISHAYAKPGVYFVKALVKLCGQVDTLLDTLVVEQKPDLSYLRDTSICEGSSVQFFRPANQPGIWNNTDTNSVFVCNQEGKYSFTVENSCGLFNQTFEVKTVKPFLQNPPQELISCGNFPQLKTTQLANKYLWNTGSTSPEILADTPGLYVLKLANNCFTGTEEFLVKNPAQQSNIVLPNAITTNADGLNENWQPITTGIQRFTYSIYSRWGDLIFSGNEQNPVWYPNANHSGVYLVELAYQPDCKEIQHKKGTITIIK